MQKNWNELIKPKKFLVDKASLTATYGKFSVEPLERGFGVTLGNSLRRILMSSLRGAAINKVKIDGVQHEFSTISGVKEDVSDIILSLKQVRLKIEGEGPKTISLTAEGPVEITAGDFECDADTEVLNKGLHVATLAKGASIEMEMNADVNKGYVPAERGEGAEQVVGSIPIDSVYNPVTRVNYEVTSARVGQRTDYDKLSLEVWTAGAVEPEEAVGIAAKILKEQLSIFITFEEEEVVLTVEKTDAPKFNENLYKTVDELELSVRSANCLKNANIKFIGEMVKRTDQEMLKTKNFGRKSLNEIKELLHEMGLDFGMEIEGFPARKELEKLLIERKDLV
ncbi:MAG: DNA-directed RNA polymerase subunit alpha [Thermodesulfobacteriota bacterium]